MNLRLVLIFFTCLMCMVQVTFAATEKPNILVFLVDDMGVMDTSVPFLVDDNGKPKKYELNRIYRTPGMQRLADQGIRFSNFYAMSVCSPTRISILTGQTSARHHTTNWIRSEGKNSGKFGPPDWQWEGITPQHNVLPKYLQKAGYTTIHSGKAHFGPFKVYGEFPQNFGFDVNIAGCSYGQPGSYYGTENFGWKKRSRRAVPDLEEYHGKDIFLTDALTIEMNKQISKSVKAQKPFFAYMAHYAVHAPFNIDQRFIKNYSHNKKPFNAFCTLIEGMDKSLGDMLDHLEELGVAEDTLVLFLGDNGSDAPLGQQHAIACAAPLRGKKGAHYEGGMRVPFIAAWAKPNSENKFQKSLPIPQGVISSAQGAVHDLFPTILALTTDNAKEITSKLKLDGKNLAPVLTTHHAPKRDFKFLMHYPHEHRTNYFTVFIENNWKVIYHYRQFKGSHYELFDLKEDPFENNNLAEENKPKLKEMMQKLSNEMQTADAQYPLAQDGKSLLKPVVP